MADDGNKGSASSSDEGGQWHARPVAEVLEAVAVDPDRGLSEAAVERRREEHGDNQLHQTEARAWWQVLLEQFHSIVVYLLAAAAVLAFATARFPEGIAVVAVILVNTAIGFVTELKAVRSMAALRRLGQDTALVLRDGDEREIEASRVVWGDVVLLQAGDLAPADLRLIEAEGLRVNEAPLTGESVPVDKTTDPVDADADLAERPSMIHRGTSVADGSGLGVVVGLGTDTELGRIVELAEEAEASITPLQKRLDQLGRRLAVLTLVVAAVVATVGFLLRRQEAMLVVETALALGIAAIPEGLPIVSTLALARGMYLMAQRNALVNRLTAVETLGATRVIFSDKTGTLTENEMKLRKALAPGVEEELGEDDDVAEWADDRSLLRRLMTVGVLCNAASLEAERDEDDPRGDPTEMALLEAGARYGLERPGLLETMPEVRVEEFDSNVMKMATFHETQEGELYVAVKGAPQAVIEICRRLASDEGDEALDDERRSDWLDQADGMASEGLRVLALADKTVTAKDADPYEDLCLVGLVGLLDPPRAGVKTAIDRCQAAGIRVEMVTGDKPQTAEAIAAKVGIIGDDDDPEAVVMSGRELGEPDEADEDHLKAIHEANIFARVSPEQKLDLVRVYQDRGEVVAMTGDGVNDAPALKKADIGVAMGARGTEAAKQVADMVLEDDALDSIVAAVEQGRVIFANIRKSVMFMLCTNVAEVLAVTVATVAGWTLPLLPLQILYLNVITDVFPALALSVGPGSGSEMDEPPRHPDEAVLTRGHWLEIAGMAVVIAASVLTSLLLAEGWLGLSRPQAITISFGTIAFGKVWFTFALRRADSRLFRNEVTSNLWVWLAVGLCIGLLLAAIFLPGLSDLLGTESPGLAGWGLLLALSLVPLIAGQILRILQRVIRGRADEERRAKGRTALSGRTVRAQ